MPRPPYRTVRELIKMIDRPARDGCLALLNEHEKLFRVSYGSAHNHQDWIGGYEDHVCEVMNLAAYLYGCLLELGRPLPFTLSDALLALFVHDLEKPWKYKMSSDGQLVTVNVLDDKRAQHEYRLRMVRAFDFHLTLDQANAVKYVEGEGGDFSRLERKMNELAAFCHMCDNLSARLYHAHPLERDDPWSGTRPSTR